MAVFPIPVRILCFNIYTRTFLWYNIHDLYIYIKFINILCAQNLVKRVSYNYMCLCVYVSERICNQSIEYNLKKRRRKIQSAISRINIQVWWY